MTPLAVQGMGGLGDNLHQRAILRQLMKHHRMWLDTPWPCVFGDFVGDRLQLVYSGSPLRTQAKNAEREKARYAGDRFPNGISSLRVFYSADAIRRCGSVLAAMAEFCGVPALDLDFRLPVPKSWHEMARIWLDRWKPNRPLMIYRPLVERKEWGGCAARNPNHAAYAALFESIRRRYFVVSIADLVPNVEWMVGEDVHPDIACHGGELDVPTIIALVQMAALTFCSPGFLVIMAQAVGTPSVCVFGGYENSSSFSAGAKFAPYLGIDPIEPCACFQHRHACKKAIDLPSALARLDGFSASALARDDVITRVT